MLFSDLRTKSVETSASGWIGYPVLAKLSELRQSPDPLDIEGSSALATGNPAEEYRNNPPEVQAGKHPALDEWERFWGAYFHHKTRERFTMTYVVLVGYARLRGIC
jgi:hypothetical protein